MKNARLAVPVTMGLMAALGATAVPAAGAHRHHATTRKVEVGDDYYSRARLTVHVGDSVRWAWRADNFATHNVILSTRPSHVRKARSRARSVDYAWRFRFRRPGTYEFHCGFHPALMRLSVRVKR